MSEKTTLTARLREAVKKLSFFAKVEEIAERRIERFSKEVRAATREIGILEKAVQSDLHKLQLQQAHRRRKRVHRKLEFWRDRYAWAHARHRHWGLVWKHRRDRLRRWIARHEGFQPYMANGNPHEKLTAEAKHAIYLDFRGGLYVTSTYEGHSGDGVHSTSSGHYLENQPDDKARCWDAGASSRGPMVKAQNREAKRAGPYCVELIGPDNDANYKNGIRYTLSEGSALETMHDTHKHQWLRDGAPK